MADRTVKLGIDGSMGIAHEDCALLSDRLHRDRLRRRGLRPIQVWVPDVRSGTFAREARRQSRLVASGTFEREEQGFLDAISEWNSE